MKTGGNGSEPGVSTAKSGEREVISGESSRKSGKHAMKTGESSTGVQKASPQLARGASENGLIKKYCLDVKHSNVYIERLEMNNKDYSTSEANYGTTRISILRNRTNFYILS